MPTPDRRSFLGAAFGTAAAAALPGVASADLGLWGGGRTLDGFPHVRQPDDISCGPACCAMVLKWYGQSAGIGPCKTKCGTRWFEAGDSKFGMSLPGGVESCLDAYGVPARVRHGSLADVTKFIDQDRPVILLLRSGVKYWHYVVAVGYSNGTGTIKLADPGEAKALTGTTGSRVDGAWEFSHDMDGKKIEGRKCRTCGGAGRVGGGWTNCAGCGGSGWWKALGGKTKCGTCGGRGKWETKGVHCVGCNGDGKEPDWFRKAVEGFGVKGHTMIVPERGRAAAKPAELVHYTIRNDSGRTVQATMQPSGKSYTFAAGHSGSYKSERVGGKAPTVRLTATGKTYDITPGDYRLVWVTGANRVEFTTSPR